MNNTNTIQANQTTGFILELDNAAMGQPQITWRRFVCEDGKAFDGSWITLHVYEAKVWKTKAGAMRWLAQRNGIKANVRKVEMRRVFRHNARGGSFVNVFAGLAA